MIRGRGRGGLRRGARTTSSSTASPALAQGGIRFSDWSALDVDDREYLVEVYQREIYPVLTPLAVDPGHPFPYISNLSLNLVVEVQDPSSGEGRIARVKVPPTLRALRGHARWRARRPLGTGHRGPPRHLVPRDDHRAPPRLPGHPQARGPRPRRGRGGRPAAGDRDGPGADAASARPCGSRSRPTPARTWRDLLATELEIGRRRRLPGGRTRST